MIVRDIFFDAVRQRPFGGSLNQEQVDGMTAILDAWEADYNDTDLRWLSYPLATTKWETSSTMQPIEEYGKGEGHEYGEKDPVTGQTYYGRGYVQMTWRENYARADAELCLTGNDSCEWHAENALKPDIAASAMFQGMIDGWYRSDSKGPHTLGRYFSDTVDDAFGAREIINGDKNYKVSWAPGKTVGQIIAEYHRDFLAALEEAWLEEPVIPPEPEDTVIKIYRLVVIGREPISVTLVPEEADSDKD